MYTHAHLAWYILVVNFILSSLKNDDMESSKRVKLLSLIFILKCLFNTVKVLQPITIPALELCEQYKTDIYVL